MGALQIKIDNIDWLTTYEIKGLKIILDGLEKKKATDKKLANASLQNQ